MNTASKLRSAGFAGATVVAMLALSATSASASGSSECTVQVFTTTCSTGTIPANYYHEIYISTYESPIGNPICGSGDIRWKVVDAGNGVVVGRGSGKGHWTIPGLYGHYYGRLDNCPRMTIDISD